MLSQAKQAHNEKIWKAWKAGASIEARHIRDDRWVDVPAYGSDADFSEDDDADDWNYRLKK